MSVTWKMEERVQKRSQFVADLNSAMWRASDLGMYKTAEHIRDKLLPLAHGDVAAATVSECTPEPST